MQTLRHEKLLLTTSAFPGPDPVLKEVAVASSDGKHVTHFLFQAPQSWTSLDENRQKLIRYDTKNVHGVCWEEGYVPYQELAKTLRRAVSRATAIYAFGEDKCKTLSKILGRCVINLQKEFKAPDPNLTALIGTRCLLPCHSVQSMHCALNTATALAQWFSYLELSLQIKNFCCQQEGKAGKRPTHTEQCSKRPRARKMRMSVLCLRPVTG